MEVGRRSRSVYFQGIKYEVELNVNNVNIRASNMEGFKEDIMKNLLNMQMMKRGIDGAIALEP